MQKNPLYLFRRRLLMTLAPLGLAGFLGASCDGQQLDLPGDPLLGTQQERGPSYGIDHDGVLDNLGDVLQDGRQVSPSDGEKLHSCGKLRYSHYLKVLESRGISINNSAANSVGALLKRAQPVWGVANYAGRLPETNRSSTSSLVSLEDIAIATAEELVSSGNSDGKWTSGACTGEKLFDGSRCNRDGFACLLGVSPSQRQLDLCNNMVADSSTGVTDEATRKRLTVAALVGVIYLCD
jgi:hypothetical protein